MATKVGINGFGRIGRLVFRAMDEGSRDRGRCRQRSRQTSRGRWLICSSTTPFTVARFDDGRRSTEDGFVVDGHAVNACSATATPLNLPWGELGVELVVESTGIFNDRRARLSKHIEAPAQRRFVITCTGQGRGHHHRYGRQRRRVRRREAQHHLERFLHHQLPGSGRQGSDGELRHQARLHEHHPFLHQRPEDPRPSA